MKFTVMAAFPDGLYFQHFKTLSHMGLSTLNSKDSLTDKMFFVFAFSLYIQIPTSYQANHIQQPTPVTGPAQRVQVQPGTPGLLKHQVATPHMTPSSHYGPPQRVQPPSAGPPMRTPNHGHGAVQNGCQSVTKATMPTPASAVKTNKDGSPLADNCVRNLSVSEEDFGLEGVARLKSPPLESVASLKSPPCSQPASTDSQSTESQSVQEASQTEQSVQDVAKQPVARTITFDSLTATANLKSSPVTGM